MKYYTVIDTNVIVSSFLKPDSIPVRVISLLSTNKLIVFINDKILGEYKDVLFRSKFDIDIKKIELFFLLLNQKAVRIENIYDSSRLFTDKSDAVFFEVTMTSRDCFDTKLITGNKRHFPDIDFVVSPREMLEYFLANENA